MYPIKIKKKRIFFLSLLLVSFLNISEVLAVIDPVTLEDSDFLYSSRMINAFGRKEGGQYFIEGIKIKDGSLAYTAGYERYKGKVYNGSIVSFRGKPLGYFEAASLKRMKCVDWNDETTKKPTGFCEEITNSDMDIALAYFPNGKTAEIYDPEGKKILNIDLTSVAICNENDICENSENINNCPSDCKDVQVVPTGGVVPVKSQETFWTKWGVAILIALGVLVVVGSVATIVFWKKIKEDKV